MIHPPPTATLPAGTRRGGQLGEVPRYLDRYSGRLGHWQLRGYTTVGLAPQLGKAGGSPELQLWESPLRESCSPSGSNL